MPPIILISPTFMLYFGVMRVNDHEMSFKMLSDVGRSQRTCDSLQRRSLWRSVELRGAGCVGRRERELCGLSVLILLSRVLACKARREDDRMERMESMEPISAHYTTAYPEIHPDSGFESRETTDSQAKTPPSPTYDEELVHKVW